MKGLERPGYGFPQSTRGSPDIAVAFRVAVVGGEMTAYFLLNDLRLRLQMVHDGLYQTGCAASGRMKNVPLSPCILSAIKCGVGALLPSKGEDVGTLG